MKCYECIVLQNGMIIKKSRNLATEDSLWLFANFLKSIIEFREFKEFKVNISYELK